MKATKRKANDGTAAEEMGDLWTMRDYQARARKSIRRAIEKHERRIPPRKRTVTAVVLDYIVPNIDNILDNLLEQE